MDLRCKYSPTLKLAITGATGYIGQNLIKLLSGNDFFPVPIEDIPNGAVIIHLAADVSNNREAMLTNIALDSLVLEIANARHRGLVYGSSNNVYPYALSCRVNELLRSNDYYSASKIFGERLIADQGKLPSLTLRIADVFGVGQRHGNFFKAIENSIRTKTPLKQFGSGLKRRSFIHVAELCTQIEYIAKNYFEDGTPSTNTAINVCYSDPASVEEILAIVSGISGVPVHRVEIGNDNSAQDFRTMQSSALYGYRPLWKGFRDALCSYTENLTKNN